MALEANIVAIDCCLSAFTPKVNRMVKVIWDHAIDITAQLNKEKQEPKSAIELSIEEANRTLYEDFPSLKTPPPPFSAIMTIACLFSYSDTR